MADGLPSQCQIALKEWASVLIAMERGEQLVLIRKGGLIEPGSGFELLAPLFVFYPTFEHQTVNFLRAPYNRYLQEALAQRPSNGDVRVALYAHAVLSTSSRDPTLVKRLESFHIYNDAFLQQRLKWQAEQPLVMTVVRVFRLATPQLLPVISRYAGCKSWVELDQPLSLQGARAVLDDQTFSVRLARLQTLLKSSASW